MYDGERGSGPEGADDLCLVSFKDLGHKAGILALILGFGPQGLNFASRLEFWPKGWNFGFKAGIWASRLGFGLQG